jgi:hypothetical protein
MIACCQLCYEKYLYKNKKINKELFIKLCEEKNIRVDKDSLNYLHQIQNPINIKYIINLFTGGYKNEKLLIEKTYCNCSCHIEGQSFLH